MFDTPQTPEARNQTVVKLKSNKLVEPDMEEFPHTNQIRKEGGSVVFSIPAGVSEAVGAEPDTTPDVRYDKDNSVVELDFDP